MADRIPFDVVKHGVTALDIYGGDFVCVQIPERIIPYILGALENYTYPDAYLGDPLDGILTSRQVEHFLTELAVSKPCPTEKPPPIMPGDTIGGGAIIIAEDDMGQVVTDVTVEDGVLYVWFGPCCKKSLGNIAEIITPDDPTPDAPDPIAPVTIDVSCRKAFVITEFLKTVVELAVTGLNEIESGHVGDPARYIREAYPWISWDPLDLYAAFFSEAILDLISGLDGLTVSQWALYQCGLATNFKPTYVISGDEWSFMKSSLHGIFDLVSDGFIHAMIDAAGSGDISKIAATATTLTEEPDCECPGALDPLTIPTENGWYLAPVDPDCSLSIGAHASKWTGAGFVTPGTHDCFGLVMDVTVSVSTGITPINKSHAVSGEDDYVSCGDFDAGDFSGSGDASGSIPTTIRYCFGHSDVLDEIFGAGTYNLISNGVTWGSTPSEPTRAAGTPIDWYWRFNPWKSAGQIIFANVYLIRNQNSPSHGA